MKNKSIQQMTISALLMAIAIVIPMISPIKIIIEPASFTLGSHIAIMIAMMISPTVALWVEIGATLGFFIAGFPIVVVLRALSQVVFVYAGAYILKKRPELFKNMLSLVLFIGLTGVLHAVSEVLVSLPFYLGTLSDSNTLLYNVFGLVGIGTFVHHCFDYGLTLMIWKVLVKSKSIQAISNIKS